MPSQNRFRIPISRLLILGGIATAVLPLILLVILAATGRMDALTSGGSVTLWFLAAGFVLIAAGLLSIWRMVHLAERV